MPINTIYRLAAGVQVRNEVFGLLFYDYRGPRLYFVPSRNLMTDTFFEGRQSVGDLLDQLCDAMPWPRGQIENQLEQVLATLEGKGLIRGESIC
jgi:putative mycofactocin binding protein MftB